jgi:CheY-like chemotaxis protein
VVVLVADDSVAVRRLLSARLRRDGHEVREASDGYEAWLAIEVEASDLLIVDDILPGLSGVELVQLLRARPAAASVRIAFLAEYDAGFAARPKRACRSPLSFASLSTSTS